MKADFAKESVAQVRQNILDLVTQCPALTPAEQDAIRSILVPSEQEVELSAMKRDAVRHKASRAAR